MELRELVLMSEDRGLPKTGLDDGSTAELSGLESAHKQQLGTSHEVSSMRNHSLHSTYPTSGQWSPSRHRHQ